MDHGKNQGDLKAIVLAAGAGRRFGHATRLRPKCLLPLGPGHGTLLERYLRSFRRLGIRDIVLVIGHRGEAIRRACARRGRGLRIRFIRNPDYRLGSVVSLYRAAEELAGPCLVMDADVFFPTKLLARLVRSPKKTCFLVDHDAERRGEEMMVASRNGRLACISKAPAGADTRPVGESVGFLKLGAREARALGAIVRDFVRRGKTHVEYENCYNVLMRRQNIGWVPTTGIFWTEMDFPKDLERIRKHLGRKAVRDQS